MPLRSITDQTSRPNQVFQHLANLVQLPFVSGSVTRLGCEPKLTTVFDPYASDNPGSAAQYKLTINYYGPSDTPSPGPDVLGKVKNIVDGHTGNTLSFQYTSAGLLQAITEAAGSVDGQGNDQSRSTTFAYQSPGLADGHPQLTQITDARGNSTQINYDPADHNLRSMFADSGGGNISQADINSLTSQLLLPNRRVSSVTLRPHAAGAGADTRTYLNKEDTPAKWTLPADPYHSGQTMSNAAQVTDARAAGGSAAGHQTTYTFDDSNRPLSITNQVGNRSELDWSQDDKVTRLTTGLVESTNGANVDAANAASSSYAYNQNGLLTQYTDPLGRQSSLSYQDSSGLYLSSLSDDSGGTFVSDLASTTDPMGATWSYTSDSRGNVIEVDSPPSSSTPGGQPIVTKATYTASRGDLTQVTEAFGTPYQRITAYSQYNNVGLPAQVVDPRGNTQGTAYTGDTHGGDPAQHTWFYDYDKAGNLLQVVDPRGTQALGNPPSSGQPDSHTTYATTFTYNLFGQVLKKTAPRCSGPQCPSGDAFAITNYAYDQNGNPAQITDADGGATSLAYTPRDQLKSVSAPAGDITSYQYDPEGSLVKTVSPKGQASGGSQSSTDYRLDGSGRVLAAVRHGNSGQQDLITSYAYDSRDNVTGVSYPINNSTLSGGSWTSVSPDQAIANASQPAHQRWALYYDKADQLLSRTEDPSGLNLTTGFAYDPAGNTTEVYQPRTFSGQSGPSYSAYVQLFQYDALGQTLSSTDPAGDTTSWTYDPVGNVLTTTPPNAQSSEGQTGGGAITDTYDANGGLLSRSIPMDQYGPSNANVSYERDALENPLTITDGRGNLIHNTFYDSGQLMSTDRPSWWQLDWGGSASPTPTSPSGASASSTPSASPSPAGQGLLPDPAINYPDQGGGVQPDLQVAQGGPTLVEGSTASAGGASQSASPTAAPGDLGPVNPQPPDSLMPRASLNGSNPVPTTFSYDDLMQLSQLGSRNPRRRYELELERCEQALEAAKGLRRRGDSLLVQVHYPPFTNFSRSNSFTALIEGAGAACCIYGHLHHEEESGFEGRRGVTEYRLVSAPGLGFVPLLLGTLTADGMSWSLQSS